MHLMLKNIYKWLLPITSSILKSKHFFRISDISSPKNMESMEQLALNFLILSKVPSYSNNQKFLFNFNDIKRFRNLLKSFPKDGK